MRRVPGLRVASAAVLCSTLAVAVPAVTGAASAGNIHATGSTGIGPRAGVTPGWQVLWESDAEQNADYAAIAATGVSWTTLDIDWNHIQDTGRDTWKWNVATDRAVLAASAHGLQVLSLIHI